MNPDQENEGGTLDVPAALRNILLLLQADPTRYQRFGIYWWPMKALLKAAGYGPENLSLLGSYMDPETAAMVPPGDLRATMTAALEEFGQNSRYPRPMGMVENADGELVTIRDEDAPI
ncbi:MAG: hypothetical protein E7K72_25840 [Roseomonas mucosa]|nr:hypothetical protein [Roseomonas mucosa]